MQYRKVRRSRFQEIEIALWACNEDDPTVASDRTCLHMHAYLWERKLNLRIFFRLL